jgi:aspartyl-tRNA(Asn)/glutamyl-tRNA(Gln) amidotransferase subunit A
VPQHFFFERVSDEVASLVEAAIRWFAARGAKIRRVPMPWLAQTEEAGTNIALPEATAYHQRNGWWPAHAQDYGEDVRKRLELGAQTSATDYWRALQLQEEARQRMRMIAEHADVLVAPTTPAVAPRIGQRMLAWGGEEETVRAAMLRLCRPANLTGTPALSIPCGVSSEDLPIGMQLIGPDERTLLRAAQAYEQAHEWHWRRPRL